MDVILIMYGHMYQKFEEWYKATLEQEVTSVLCELPFDQSTIEHWLSQAWLAGKVIGYSKGYEDGWGEGYYQGYNNGFDDVP